MDKFLEVVTQFAYQETARTSLPPKMHLDLSAQVGERLARQLNADVTIVRIGTLLMDCQLGQALIDHRLPDHVQMSVDKTNELLSDFDFSAAIKENIRHCVGEHHGVSHFYSLESEICCNADCYRFASVKGFNITTRYLQDMSYEDSITLLASKLIEKEQALTLDICQQELGDQIDTLHKYIEYLKQL